MQSGFRLGLIINPLAGVGGQAALKGSDGVAEQALAQGVLPQAQRRVAQALELLLPLRAPWGAICLPNWALRIRWSVS